MWLLTRLSLVFLVITIEVLPRKGQILLMQDLIMIYKGKQSGYHWLRWRGRASSRIGVPVIPAKPLHIALFITELTNICLENNTGVSSIEAVVYGIKWAHSMAGLEICPANHPLAGDVSGAWPVPDFLSCVFPTGFFEAGFFWPPWLAYLKFIDAVTLKIIYLHCSSIN